MPEIYAHRRFINYEGKDRPMLWKIFKKLINQQNRGSRYFSGNIDGSVRDQRYINNWRNLTYNNLERLKWTIKGDWKYDPKCDGIEELIRTGHDALIKQGKKPIYYEFIGQRMTLYSTAGPSDFEKQLEPSYTRHRIPEFFEIEIPITNLEGKDALTNKDVRSLDKIAKILDLDTLEIHITPIDEGSRSYMQMETSLIPKEELKKGPFDEIKIYENLTHQEEIISGITNYCLPVKKNNPYRDYITRKTEGFHRSNEYVIEFERILNGRDIDKVYCALHQKNPDGYFCMTFLNEKTRQKGYKELHYHLTLDNKSLKIAFFGLSKRKETRSKQLKKASEIISEFTDGTPVNFSHLAYTDGKTKSGALFFYVYNKDD